MTTETVWRGHPTFVHYEISTDGRVRSLDRETITTLGIVKRYKGRELKPATNPYPTVMLTEQGHSLPCRVHVLMCETYYGPRPGPGYEVRHLNGDPTDNRLQNIAWGTKSENAQDTLRHGRHNHYQKTHCKHGHEFTAANTRMDTAGRRVCRECKRAAYTRQKEKTPRLGNYNTRKTHCKQGHEFTPENTARWPGRGRACRQCHRERQRKHRK